MRVPILGLAMVVGGGALYIFSGDSISQVAAFVQLLIGVAIGILVGYSWALERREAP